MPLSRVIVLVSFTLNIWRVGGGVNASIKGNSSS